MTFSQGLAYIMRHAWLWPLLFWLRPLETMERVGQDGKVWAEPACAVIGGAAWGAAVGTLIWVWAGDITTIWALAGAFAGAFTGAFVVTAAVANAFVVVFAGTFAFVFAGAGAGAVSAAFIGLTYMGIAAAGIAIAQWLPAGIVDIFALITAIIVLIFPVWAGVSDKTPKWVEPVLVTFLLLFLPLAAFALFPRSTLTEMPIWE
jgi:hypothetical protein